MITTLPCRSTRLAGLAGVTVLALSLAACSSGTTDEADGEDTGGSGATDATSFTVLTASDGAVNAWNAILETLAAGECAAEEAALPLEISTQQGATYDQQLQLLAGQDALPNLLVAAGTPALNIELADAGKLLDVGAALEDLGVADAVLPAAATTVTNLYDGNAIALPTEFNIEGIWYNKQILTDNRIDVPTTWVELTDAMATLQAAGVQPISAAGEGADGWGSRAGSACTCSARSARTRSPRSPPARRR